MRMKHAFRRLLCLLLSAAALLSLAACTSPLEEKLWEILTPTLVQGDLDALYLGEFNENYLDLTGASEEDCQSAYEQNLSLSADIFARCFGITNLTDDLRSEVEDLYREIYARAHYSVVGAVQIDETHYTVTVNVEPMDFFTPVLDGFDDAMVGFRARWIDYVDVSRMTDEQYAAFELDWRSPFSRGAAGISMASHTSLSRPLKSVSRRMATVSGPPTPTPCRPSTRRYCTTPPTRAS